MAKFQEPFLTTTEMYYLIVRIPRTNSAFLGKTGDLKNTDGDKGFTDYYV